METLDFEKFERAYIAMHDGKLKRELADSAEWLNISRYLLDRDPYD
jgi:hypothetical protein